ncbi:MAG: hypothetical protein ACRC28_17575 [Clostridium sp.]|uniref:hypothetical protein n=1 Tax=Clostridium sp. TaxID=1506 RepID=UPI003F34E32B
MEALTEYGKELLRKQTEESAKRIEKILAVTGPNPDPITFCNEMNRQKELYQDKDTITEL